MSTRKRLLADVSRCYGDTGAPICQTCARRIQMAHDDPQGHYSYAVRWPSLEGECLDWIEEVEL
jgi:hypothetical protein